MQKIRTEFIRVRFRKEGDLTNPTYGRPIRIRKEFYGTINKNGEETIKTVKYFKKTGYIELDSSQFITEWKKGPTPTPKPKRKYEKEARSYSAKDVKKMANKIFLIEGKKVDFRKLKFSEIRELLDTDKFSLQEYHKQMKEKRKNANKKDTTIRRKNGSFNAKVGNVYIHIKDEIITLPSKNFLTNPAFKKINKENILDIRFTRKKGDLDASRKKAEEKRIVNRNELRKLRKEKKSKLKEHMQYAENS